MPSHLDTGVGKRKVSSATPGLASMRVAFTEIPMIDFSAMYTNDPKAKAVVAQNVHRACVDVGFFYVVGHGVQPELIERLLGVSREFFAQDTAEKKRIDVSKSSFNRGYIPLYGEKNNEHAKGDVKESFDVAIEIDERDPDFLSGNPLYGPNQWPRRPTDFRPTVSEYFAEVSNFCDKLYESFALSLGLPENYFQSMLAKPLDILRLLRYPPQPHVADESQIGTGAHSDFDCFTVLYQDSTGGLQVLNSKGIWIDALPIDGAFLVNVGDMLERWTNGRFVSTVHRVINRSENERYSTVFFAAPSYDAVVDCLATCQSKDHPPQYEPVKAGDYIVSRYEAVLG